MVALATRARGAAAHLRKSFDSAIELLRVYERLNDELREETAARAAAFTRAAEFAAAIVQETSTPAREERMLQLSNVLTEIADLFGMSGTLSMFGTNGTLSTLSTRVLGEYAQGGVLSVTKTARKTRQAYLSFLTAVVRTINSLEHVERLSREIPPENTKANAYIRDTLRNIGEQTFADLNREIENINVARKQVGVGLLRHLESEFLEFS